MTDVSLWSSLGWLLLTFIPFLIFQRIVHQEIQLFFFLLTRKQEVALVIFSLIFLPGVIVHEFSHYLMAIILRVPARNISLLPRRTTEGKLQLGSVQTGKTDLLRASLIGLAPLLSGGALVAYLGMNNIGMGTLITPIQLRDFSLFITALRELPQQTDFWLWLYLVFVISSTMLPSESDRSAWIPVLIVIVVISIISIILGIGPWLHNMMGQSFNQLLLISSLIFGISLILHILIYVPTRTLRYIFSRLLHVNVTTT